MFKEDKTVTEKTQELANMISGLQTIDDFKEFRRAVLDIFHESLKILYEIERRIKVEENQLHSWK